MQGSSAITSVKEAGVYGLVKMRTKQLKGSASRHFDELLYLDVFCGDGVNVVDAERVNGSPIQVLSALDDALYNKNGFAPGGLNDKTIRFEFSDVNGLSVQRLQDRLVGSHWQFTPTARGVNHYFYQAPADWRIRGLTDYLQEHPRAYAVVVIDPNGPMDLPFKEILNLLAYGWSQVDLIINVSATAIKRCVMAKRRAAVNIGGWLTTVDNILIDFFGRLSYGREDHTLIRTPIAGDPQQWFVLASFMPRMRLNNAWEKAGYHFIREPMGQIALQRYARTQHELVHSN